jgi:hypothetical protein
MSAPDWVVRDLYDLHSGDHAFGTFDIAVHMRGKCIAYSDEIYATREDAEADLAGMRGKGLKACLVGGELRKAGRGEPLIATTEPGLRH